MNSRMTFGLTLVAMFGFSGSALAQEYGGANIGTSDKEPFGKYLTDSSGVALYMFEQDKPGQSTCYDACAGVWPPLLATEPVKEGMVDTIERKDGGLQLTFNGMPLYYYAKDEGRAGSTEGQDVDDQFGEWYLVAPSGEKVEDHG